MARIYIANSGKPAGKCQGEATSSFHKDTRQAFSLFPSPFHHPSLPVSLNGARLLLAPLRNMSLRGHHFSCLLTSFITHPQSLFLSFFVSASPHSPYTSPPALLSSLQSLSVAPRMHVVSFHDIRVQCKERARPFLLRKSIRYENCEKFFICRCSLSCK